MVTYSELKVKNGIPTNELAQNGVSLACGSCHFLNSIPYLALRKEGRWSCVIGADFSFAGFQIGSVREMGNLDRYLCVLEPDSK